MKFVLNGCDISFIAEAPDDITLSELIRQCDRIKPMWCACGICSLEAAGYKNHEWDAEIVISKNDVYAVENASCTIEPMKG